MSRHHRRPKAQKGKNSKRNISWVSQVEHRSWHTIFNGMLTPLEIADIINTKFLDPDWELIAIRKEKP